MRVSVKTLDGINVRGFPVHVIGLPEDASICAEGYHLAEIRRINIEAIHSNVFRKLRKGLPVVHSFDSSLGDRRVAGIRLGVR